MIVRAAPTLWGMLMMTPKVVPTRARNRVSMVLTTMLLF
jgi:hypothetical protein